MSTLLFFSVFSFFCIVFSYRRMPLYLWAIFLFTPGLLYIFSWVDMPVSAAYMFTGVAGVSVLLSIRPIRRALITPLLLRWFRQKLPPISQTEREALDAGTVWWDGELFKAKPNWRKLFDMNLPKLSTEEEDFLEGPTNTLCRMIDDWDVTHERADLSEATWRYLREEGFFGLIIPKKYGGKGFSALAHSEIVMKISTRSMSAGVNAMVPNSLGPAELLLKYGTDAQKSYYLPRLAKGEEVPCFALTAPSAGSDAGAIPDVGVVCEQEWRGKKTLGLRINWDKRYITLAPIATLLGLAFKVEDPDGLLGGERSLGITCALIPTTTHGITIGRRHFALNAAFMNGPTQGVNVFIPMEYVIGGQARIGQGWRMLMNCLSVGRSISLPALGTGAAKFSALCTGAYARIRTQFKVPIGTFEGVEEPLARIGGSAYLMDAARVFTAGAVDLGEKPAVPSAIVKYHLTERMRDCVDDAMDVHGGRGIILGPKNYLARLYQSVPVSITVEGANILTRSLMIFGQGAIRCHPFVLKEMMAAEETDERKALVNFDNALFAHVGFTMSNFVISIVHVLTRGVFSVHADSKYLQPYLRKVGGLAANFSIVADCALLFLGGELKRKEKLSARLGDALSELYIASSVLKKFHDEGQREEDSALFHWAMQQCCYRAQEALLGVLDNFPSKPFSLLLRMFTFPFGRRFKEPNDKLGHQVAELLLKSGGVRNRLCRGAYASGDENDPIGRVLYAFRLVTEAAPVERKVRDAISSKSIRVAKSEDALAVAYAEGLISEPERLLVEISRQAVESAIAVDDFDHNALSRVQSSQVNTRDAVGAE